MRNRQSPHDSLGVHQSQFVSGETSLDSTINGRMAIMAAVSAAHVQRFYSNAVETR